MTKAPHKKQKTGTMPLSNSFFRNSKTPSNGAASLSVIFFAASGFLYALPTAAQPEKKMDSPCAGEAIVDATTGTLLDGKNAHQPMLPASTSKLMTLLLIEEEIAKGTISPSDSIIFYGPKSATSPRAETTCAPLSKGPMTIERSLTIDEAERALAALSDNHAALALQKKIEDLNKTSYATLVQERTARLGMKNTKLIEGAGISNTSHCNGLNKTTSTPTRVADDLAERYKTQGQDFITHSKQNITTPYDLALLIGYIGENIPRLHPILSATSFTLNGIHIPKRGHFLIKTANELIGKTGYTTPAGPSLTAYTIKSRVSFAVMQCIPTAPIAGGNRDQRADQLLKITKHFPERTRLPEEPIPSIVNKTDSHQTKNFVP